MCSYFWLDTLCIPVHKDFQHLRDFSIRKMHDIFKFSFRTLVSDHDIYLATGNPTFLEIATRMVLSAWVTRLWTVQEGDLPPRLFLRVQGGKLDYDKLRRRYSSASNDIHQLDKTLHGGFSKLYANYMPRRIRKFGRSKLRFDEIWTQQCLYYMRLRTTSRKVMEQSASPHRLVPILRRF